MFIRDTNEGFHLGQKVEAEENLVSRADGELRPEKYFFYSGGHFYTGQ